MLEGEVDYRHGDQVYPLKPGDSLFFDADAPHGPEVLVKLPARYLVGHLLPAGVRRQGFRRFFQVPAKEYGRPIRCAAHVARPHP
jgi:hypothetical protein